jgi:cytochrome c peroxidase
MRSLTICSLAAAVVLGAAPASADDLLTRAQAAFKPIPSVVPSVRDNIVTPDKVELGKMLFFDPRLSSSEMISCNTCHNLATGGVDARSVSASHGSQTEPRRTTTIYNAIFNAAQFWDGRAEDLKAQTTGPVEAGVGMSVTPEQLVQTLVSMPGYVEQFHRAFPNQPNPVSFENFAKAIEAFDATLITPGSRFDQYLQGDASALNDQEKTGLGLFMDKKCAGCHNGINVGGEGYFPFGVVERPGADILPPEDKARFDVAKTANEQYVFRAAPLRNVALRAPYFHTGKVWSLKQAVGIMGSAQMGIQLTDQEEDAIVAFLKTLTGQLPKIEYPILPVRTDSTPTPRLTN